MVPEGLIRVRPDRDRPSAIHLGNPLDGALNHEGGPGSPLRRPPFQGTLVGVDLMGGQPLMAAGPRPMGRLRPNPSDGEHQGPGVGGVRSTIIGQGAVRDSDSVEWSARRHRVRLERDADRSRFVRGYGSDRWDRWDADPSRPGGLG